MTAHRGFPALAASAFQHPYDVAAIQTLNGTPGLNIIAKIVSGNFYERIANIEYTGHSVRVDSSQYSSIFRRYVTLAERLDVRELPALYIKNSNEANAYAQGIQHYFIVVNTGLLDILDEDELDAVLAHELGHIKCNHMKYVTMIQFLRALGPEILQFLNIPLAPTVLLGAQIALVQWYQKSEFSADRAALLGTQSLEAVQHTLGKLTGYSPRFADRLNLESLKRQANDFDDIGTSSFLEKALKAWTLLNLTHPVPVVRIREIELWAASSSFNRLMDGEYHRSESLLATGPMEFCMGCQRAQPASRRFCGHCGRQLKEVPPPPPP